MRNPFSALRILAIHVAFFGLFGPEALADLTAVWINDGGVKVTQEERPGTEYPERTRNSVWQDGTIRVFGAKNEIVSFNLILEAGDTGATAISVRFDSLKGDKGTVLGSAYQGNLFNWVGRPIELFFVRYVQVEGLSKFSYDVYDERHIPESLRLPHDENGYLQEGLTWKDRPKINQHFPDIAVPLELHPAFDIAPRQSQAIWADIYIPRDLPADTYRGELAVLEKGDVLRRIPVELRVRNFILPEEPSSKTMVYLGYENVNERYFGRPTIAPDSSRADDVTLLRDRHFMLAHRHKISLVDANRGVGKWEFDRPRKEWVRRLDGTLFSPNEGYEGPGIFTGNGIFSIGNYNTWAWRADFLESSMHRHTDNWEKWFQRYAQDPERFLYLVDESTDYHETEIFAHWMRTNKGPGRELRSFATVSLLDALKSIPNLDIIASLFVVGETDKWEAAMATVAGSDQKKLWLYNGKRPATGSFATEDDGVALRQLPWAQFKKKIDRWFYWESTYYTDYQKGSGENDLFRKAKTIGTYDYIHETHGKGGFDNSNGDGVLFYPGTNQVHPRDSYGVLGPFASLRLKHWRRGIQDIDYLTLARKRDPRRVEEIVNRMVPKVLWEYGVSDPSEPTWVRTAVSWSSNPDDWEQARRELADLIESTKE